MKSKLLLACALLSTAILPTLSTPAHADEKTTDLQVKIVSGGITVTATDTINFGQVNMGKLPKPAPVALNVTNKTGSLGWKLTAKLNKAITGVNLEWATDAGSAGTVIPSTGDIPITSKTGAEPSITPVAVNGVIKASTPNPTVGKFTTGIVWTVSSNPS